MIFEPDKNERTLVCKLKDGDVSAFDFLFNKYYQKLFNYSLSLLENKEDANDIVQDTFYKIWETKCQLDSSKSFKAFLFTISYHMIIDKLRVKLQEQVYKKYFEDTVGISSVFQENQMDFHVIERLINGIVDELPGKRKEIYYLSRKGGLHHKEIATLLGISTKTVENQINLSLKYIKLKLSKEITVWGI